MNTISKPLYEGTRHTSHVDLSLQLCLIGAEYHLFTSNKMLNAKWCMHALVETRLFSTEHTWLKEISATPTSREGDIWNPLINWKINLDLSLVLPHCYVGSRWTKKHFYFMLIWKWNTKMRFVKEAGEVTWLLSIT